VCYCRLLAVVERRLIRRLNGCMLDENVDINDFCISALMFIYASIAIERETHDKVCVLPKSANLVYRAFALNLYKLYERTTSIKILKKIGSMYLLYLVYPD
jgi:hypothetical protein